MKYLQALLLAAMALMAIGAASASATTLERDGVAQTGAVTLSVSVEPGTSTLLQPTSGSFASTCTGSTMTAKTFSFTAESSKPISGPLSSLTFSSCTTSPVTVDKFGSLTVEWISGTTNGTLRSAGAEVTVPSVTGTLNCKTGEGVDIGTLTGKESGGTATVDVNAVLNCGFLAPSVTWTGSYLITSPQGIGVVK